MTSKLVVRSESYFQTFGPLPFFEIFVLRAIFEPYEAHRLADGTQFVDILERCQIQAEAEVAAHCVKLDIGQSILLSSPLSELMEMYNQCLNLTFTSGVDACSRIIKAARSLEHVPKRLYSYVNVAAMSPEILRDMSPAFVRIDNRFASPPSAWDDRQWSRYFRTFPGDAFRIPILAGIGWLANHAPEQISPRVQQLFPRFFDTGFQLEHVRWDEYDSMPGRSKPEEKSDEDDEDDYDEDDENDDDE